MNKRHDLACLKKHLKKLGKHYLNGEGATSEYRKGRGDAFLRVVDMLNGEVSGDSCVIWDQDCVCKRKRKLCYDHYEEAK